MVEPLEVGAYREFVRRCLAEDLGWGDATAQAAVDPNARAEGAIVMRAAGVVAGLDVAVEVFRQMDPSMSAALARHDGDECAAGDRLATLTGLAGPMLTAERTALNLLTRLSGIATLTRRYVAAAAGRLSIADTRKTSPLLRELEKYAVRVGGGQNGRFTLDEGVILKSNHLAVAGSIAAAVRKARSTTPDTPVQVEVQSAVEVDEALAAGAGVLLWGRGMTDGLLPVLQRAQGRARVEVSGRIAIADLDALAAAGADFVSIGALTESAPAADITLELRSL